MGNEILTRYPASMMRWLSKRRRARLEEQPWPDTWDGYLLSSMGAWELLRDEERQRLRGIVHVLMAEKRWRGCAGLELTDPIRVLIAAQAGLLLLGLEHDYYCNVTEILVYPDAYRGRQKQRLPGGVVSDAPVTRLGEAWVRGPVVLSWRAARQGARDPRDGHNVVYHEFAHKLDMLDGTADGVPPLGRHPSYRRWYQAMTEHYQALQRDLAQGRRGLLQAYGATAPEEFFAVAVEAFFEQGRRLEQEAPDLYGVLRDYFRQDPASWKRSTKRGTGPDAG